MDGYRARWTDAQMDTDRRKGADVRASHLAVLGQLFKASTQP